MKKLSVSKRGMRRGMIGLLWILPALVMLCVFCLYPTISAFIHSFTDWNGADSASFVGFSNYAELFRDKLFWRSLLNVIILTVVSMVIGNIATFLLAELIYNLQSPFVSVYRFLFVLPAMVPGVVTMLLWQKLILSPMGVANSLLGIFGIPPQEWFASENVAMVFTSIFLYGFPWMGGTSFLIYLAGLNSIGESVIEASKLEGLSTFRRVFLIDLPMIKGQLKYFLIMGIIGGLQNYTMQFTITFGGPGGSLNDSSLQSGTMVPGYYIYRLITDASKVGAYGYACTIGVMMFAIIMIITVVNKTLLKSEDE